MGILRRILQIGLVVATLLVGAAAAVIIVSQTAWFKDWLRGFIVRQANQYLNGSLSIGRLGGNLFFGLEFEDLGVTQAGERVIAIRSAGIDYSVIQFVSGNVVIDHIRLDRPVVTIERGPDGWNLGQLVKRERRENQRTGPGRTVTIGEVGISDGTFLVRRGEPAVSAGVETGTAGTTHAGVDREQGVVNVPRTIDRVDARFSFRYEPVHYSVDIGHLSLRAHDPDIELNDLSGRIAERDDKLYLDDVAIRTAESSVKVAGEISRTSEKTWLKMEATSDKLDVPEVGRLVPALSGIPLQPSFRVKARGPLDAVAFDFAVRSSAGDASGQLTADLVGREHGLQGEIHMKDLDLAPIVRTPAARTILTGLARVNVRFPAAPGRGPVAGTFSVSAFSARFAGYRADQIEARGRVDGSRVFVERGKAVAYGAAATASGTVEPGVRGANGSRGLAIDLQGAVAGLDLRRLPRSVKVPPFDSRLNFDYHVEGVGTAVSGRARLGPSTLAGAHLAEGTIGEASNKGPEVAYSAQGGVANLDIQRYGRVLGIPALAADWFKSDISGQFSAKGRGSAAASLTLDANAAINGSTLDGVSIPLMSLEAHLAGGGGRFRADGGFFNLDPARLTGKPETKGNAAGRVNVEASLARLAGPITPDSVAASGEVALDRSTVGGLQIERGLLSGRFANSAGEVHELAITSPDLVVKASGPLSLGDAGDSNLAYHVETPNLSAVGTILGQQQLGGFLSFDGRVTGNGKNLAARGRLEAGNVHYGSSAVLTANSTYDLTMPDLDVGKAQAKADTTLAFVKVAGQDINVVRAATTYAGKQLAFDVTAEQPVRSGRVAGTLLLHPDHHEVHVSQLGLKTQGMEWSIAPNTSPVVRYGGGTVAIKGMHLVSGEQSIAAEGTLGSQSSNLRAALTNVDLGRVDTWLIGDRRLGGTLNAAATVTGPTSALGVTGDFAVDAGSFREFRYDTLGGTVTYAKDRLTLDVRLQQNPEAWLFARGTLPAALFEAPTTPSGAPSPGSDAPVDVTIRSSPIDLGVIQGFTSAITKASGTLTADAHVGGTAAVPQMSGRVEVSNGMFTVAAAGVDYKALNGRIDLQPGRAVIDRLSVTDEHDRTMTLSGELGVQGRSVGALKLKVASRKFEILHNDIGRVTLNSDLTVGGQLRAPEIQGQVAVNTATINLDRVLDLATSSAYSTQPASTGLATGETTASGTPLAGTTGATVPVGMAGRGQTHPAGTAAAPPVGASRASLAATATPAGVSGGRPGLAAPEVSGSIPDAATLDVTLKVPDDLVVNGKDIQPGNTPIGLGNVNITLGGDLRISKRPGTPLRYAGQVDTVRGTYDFQGRRFDIQRGGIVRFDGSVPVNPLLDIAATRIIAGVEARVHVGGTMRKPELTLTSNPPLDQADILSLIVFNAPANELGEGQQVSLAQRAGAIATGFVASKLADSIGRALNLDVFEIQTEATPGGGQGATVTIGEQVGRNLYFRVVQGVGAENTSQFVLDYQLANFLRLETTVSQGGTATRTPMRRTEQSGVDLIFFFSY
jgi:hypothetical protein